MLMVLTPGMVLSPRALQTTAVPRPVLGKGLGISPKRTIFTAVFWRIVFEHSLPRYVVALLPFVAAMFIWPELALPISQAPVLMLGLVLFIESSVLSISSPDRRRALIGEAEAARALDLMRIRGKEVLTQIATRRGLFDGTLTLVIEQSAMARVAPLTVVSVRFEGDEPVLLELDMEEQRLLRVELFGGGLDERLLQRVNLAANTFLRSVALDVRSISAHARLEAMAKRSFPSGQY